MKPCARRGAILFLIERCFTPVDILVANAYIHLKRQPPLLQTPIEDYIEQYNGTVLQNLHLIHTFIPKLQQQGGGRYIGINTVASVNCLTTQAAYSTSKRALDGLLRTLAKEVAKDRILVNQIFRFCFFHVHAIHPSLNLFPHILYSGEQKTVVSEKGRFHFAHSLLRIMFRPPSMR